MIAATNGAGVPVDDTQTGAMALEVAGLHVNFHTRRGTVEAATDVDLHVRSGEVLALLGESGSGKSVTARAIMGLLRGRGVEVGADVLRLGDTDLRGLDDRAMAGIRGERLSLVFQDALSALNPVHTIGQQIGEMFRVHRGATRKEAKEQAIDLLRMVGIPSPERRVDDHPHQFSGGMRQRILIAIGIALRPDVLIADEPTTALDVTVQAQVLELLDRLRDELGMALVLITHDLGVVAKVADRVAVMYAGRIVETATTAQIFDGPAHPYTEALLRSVPRLSRADDELSAIPGAPPSPTAKPSGCAFHPRCHRRIAPCDTDRPLLEPLPGNRASACHVKEEMLDA